MILDDQHQIHRCNWMDLTEYKGSSSSNLSVSSWLADWGMLETQVWVKPKHQDPRDKDGNVCRQQQNAIFSLTPRVIIPTIFQTHLLINKRTLGQLRWQLTLHQLSRGAFEAELPVCLTRKHRRVGFTLRLNVRPYRLSKWNLNLKPQILLYDKPFCTLALRKRKVCRRIKVSLFLKWKKIMFVKYPILFYHCCIVRHNR